MLKKRDKLIERRKYIRLRAPVAVTYTIGSGPMVYKTVSKDISADGIRIEASGRSLKEGDVVELKLDIPGAQNPVHMKGKVVWKKRSSLADGAPFEVGIAFTEIEEDNKNTFLRFLCDIIYNLTKENQNAKKKA